MRISTDTTKTISRLTCKPVNIDRCAAVEFSGTLPPRSAQNTFKSLLRSFHPRGQGFKPVRDLDISFRMVNQCEDTKLKSKLSTIDWAAANVAPWANSPDGNSSEYMPSELQQLTEALPSLGLGKQRITIMLDEAVVQAYKAKTGGRGYQTLINDTLRRALEADSVKEALREVIREEFRHA